MSIASFSIHSTNYQLIDANSWRREDVPCVCLVVLNGLDHGDSRYVYRSALIEWLESLADEFPDMVVVFAYLRYTEQITAWDVILALIVQLVRWSHRYPDVVAIVQAALERHRRRKSTPSLAELVKLLKTIFKQFPEAFALIDGLDEMKQETQQAIIEIMSSVEAHVLFTSRGMPLLEDQVKDLRGDEAVFVNVAAQSEDLDLFINDAIKRNPTLGRLLDVHNIKAKVISTIKEKSGGM